jgi:exopolysaccharide biosynthesis polyprenyl glycosylphosphotransferase
MRRRNEMIYTLALILIDLLALFEAFNLAYKLRADQAKPFAHFISAQDFGLTMLLVSPMWALIFGVCGLYGGYGQRGRLSELGRTVVAVAGGVMTLIVVDYMKLGTVFPSRAVPLLAFVTGIVFVTIGRKIVRSVARALFVQGRGLHNVVVVGVGDLAQRVTGDLDQARGGYRIVAAVDPTGKAETFQGVPVYPDLPTAVSAAQVPIDEVVQADLSLDQATMTDLIGFATRRGISYRFVPNQFGVYAAGATLGMLGGIPVMEVRLTPLEGWGRLSKRAFDTLGALAGLILLSPIFLAVVAALKVTEPGAPVLYQQLRVGRGSRSIGVLKFRSMSWAYSPGPGRPFSSAVDAFAAMGRPDLVSEFEVHHKVADDPRVTKVGKFLRKTSLDELPQLFNVLRGELSLVGPRPITVAEYERYGLGGPTYLALKPGITGLWQVSGRSDVGYNERVKLDIHYVENWNLALDVRIILKTVAVVLARRGAY